MATIDAMRAEVAQLTRDVAAAAEGTAQANDRMADRLEELSVAIAESAEQRDALAAEMRELDRRLGVIEAALATIIPDMQQS